MSMSTGLRRILSQRVVDTLDIMPYGKTPVRRRRGEISNGKSKPSLTLQWSKRFVHKGVMNICL